MGRLTARARDANDMLLDTFREAVSVTEGWQEAESFLSRSARSEILVGQGQEN